MALTSRAARRGPIAVTVAQPKRRRLMIVTSSRRRSPEAPRRSSRSTSDTSRGRRVTLRGGGDPSGRVPRGAVRVRSRAGRCRGAPTGGRPHEPAMELRHGASRVIVDYRGLQRCDCFLADRGTSSWRSWLGIPTTSASSQAIVFSWSASRPSSPTSPLPTVTRRWTPRIELTSGRSVRSNRADAPTTHFAGLSPARWLRRRHLFRSRFMCRAGPLEGSGRIPSDRRPGVP